MFLCNESNSKFDHVEILASPLLTLYNLLLHDILDMSFGTTRAWLLVLSHAQAKIPNHVYLHIPGSKLGGIFSHMLFHECRRRPQVQKMSIQGAVSLKHKQLI